MLSAVDVRGSLVIIGRLGVDDRVEVDIAVRQVNGESAIGFQEMEIEAERFLRHQVDRDGVVGEGVEHEYVETARRFLCESKAPIVLDDINLRARVTEKVEVIRCYADDLWIDFVVSEHVAGAA